MVTNLFHLVHVCNLPNNAEPSLSDIVIFCKPKIVYLADNFCRLIDSTINAFASSI